MITLVDKTIDSERKGNRNDVESILSKTDDLVYNIYGLDSDDIENLDRLNRDIHRQLVNNGDNIPSTTIIKNKLVIRPCFIGARTQMEHAIALVDEVVEIGLALCSAGTNKYNIKGINHD